MAEARKAKGRKAGARGDRETRRGFRFGPLNYAVFGAGFATIVLGYVLLDAGSVTAAPFLLILGYAILLPLGLLIGWKKLGAGD